MKSPAERRQTVLNRMVLRLDRRIASLEARSRTLSWVRLTLFLAWPPLSPCSRWAVSERAGAWALAVGVAGFSAVALAPPGRERRLARHRAFRRLKADLLSRMTLDWDALPPAKPIEAAGRPPLCRGPGPDGSTVASPSCGPQPDPRGRPASGRLAAGDLATVGGDPPTPGRRGRPRPPHGAVGPPQAEAEPAWLRGPGHPHPGRLGRAATDPAPHGPAPGLGRHADGLQRRRLSGVEAGRVAANLDIRTNRLDGRPFFQMRDLAAHFLKLLELDDGLSALRTLFAGLESLPPGRSGALAEALAPLQASANRPSALLKKIKRVTVPSASGPTRSWP